MRKTGRARPAIYSRLGGNALLTSSLDLPFGLQSSGQAVRPRCEQGRRTVVGRVQQQGGRFLPRRRPVMCDLEVLGRSSGGGGGRQASAGVIVSCRVGPTMHCNNRFTAEEIVGELLLRAATMHDNRRAGGSSSATGAGNLLWSPAPTGIKLAARRNADSRSEQPSSTTDNRPRKQQGGAIQRSRRRQDRP